MQGSRGRPAETRSSWATDDGKVDSTQLSPETPGLKTEKKSIALGID